MNLFDINWKELAKTTTTGYKPIFRFLSVTATKVRWFEMNQTFHLVFGQEHRKNISVDIRENDVLFFEFDKIIKH